MPELPEVHALVSDLGARLSGRTIERFEMVSFAALKTFDPSASSLAGKRIEGVSRHGKFLDFTVSTEGATGSVEGATGSAEGTDAATGSAEGTPASTGSAEGAEATGGRDTATPTRVDAAQSAVEGSTSGERLHLVLHLARAGWIRWREGPPPPPSGRPGKGPLAARLVLADDGIDVAGSGLDITEAGTKKSLALYLVRDVAEVPGIARLGPDPLVDAFTEDVFAGILAGSGRAQIKGVLRNQSVIAGIGNAYSDEILHAARMSPFKAAAMTAEETSALYRAMQSTLRGAIARADGLAASELKREKKSGLQVHGRTGEPCPVCGDTVRQVTYADSSLQYCPTCQTGGKPLADRVLSRLLK